MTATPSTDSRIANSSRSWQAACDVDITDWDKANDFILSTWMQTDAPHGNETKNWKLQWKEAGGSFADVGADTEICYTADTVLVNETLLVLGTSAQCQTFGTGEESEGDNAHALKINAGDWGEMQWALSFGSGAQYEVTYEFQIVNTDDATSAICSVSITTLAAPVPTLPQTDSRIANASASWQGACDIDITNWNETAEFILSTYATGGSGINKDFKLQRRLNGASWIDLSGSGGIKWGINTVLVDGNNVANPAGCLSSTKSEENEGDNTATLDTMGASDVGEIQWAIAFNAPAPEDVYEFKLINTTDSTEAICSCSITLRQHSEPFGVGRIADSSASWQATCGNDVVNWDKADEFILSTYAIGGDGGNKEYKLQFDIDADKNWTDVGVDTEIRYATAGETVLVDGNTVATPAGCLTSDESMESEADNSATVNNVDIDDTVEIQWGLGFGSGAGDNTTYGFRLFCITDAEGAQLSDEITTQAGVGATINKINGVLDSAISKINGVIYSGVSKVNGVATS